MHTLRRFLMVGGELSSVRNLLYFGGVQQDSEEAAYKYSN